MSDIRTRPTTQQYRDGYDLAFGVIDDELADLGGVEEDAALAAAYTAADREYAETGAVSLNTGVTIFELGGDVSKYC